MKDLKTGRVTPPLPHDEYTRRADAARAKELAARANASVAAAKATPDDDDEEDGPLVNRAAALARIRELEAEVAQLRAAGKAPAAPAQLPAVPPAADPQPAQPPVADDKAKAAAAKK